MTQAQEDVWEAVVVDHRVVWQLQRSCARDWLFKVWCPTIGDWVVHPVSEQLQLGVLDPSPVGHGAKCLVLKMGCITCLLDFPTRTGADRCLAAYRACRRGDTALGWQGPEVRVTPEVASAWWLDAHTAQVLWPRREQQRPDAGPARQAVFDACAVALAMVMVGVVCAMRAKLCN